MAIYVLKPFDRNTKGDAIDSAKLCKAALEVMAGIYEASFGGGVYKKRIPLVAGKSGGARAVVAFKTEKHFFSSTAMLNPHSKVVVERYLNLISLSTRKWPNNCLK